MIAVDGLINAGGEIHARVTPAGGNEGDYLNGYGKDVNWQFKSDGTFWSFGPVIDMGQLIYSPNNPPPVNNRGAATGVRLSALGWAGKIVNDPQGYQGGRSSLPYSRMGATPLTWSLVSALSRYALKETGAISPVCKE